MAEDSQPGEEERRFLEILEQAALHDYPNPDRKGCPGAQFLRTLAFDRQSVPISDSRLDHLGKCSPCFREFTEFRVEAKGRRAAAKRAGVLSLAAAAVLIPSVWFWSRSRQSSPRSEIAQSPAPVAYAKAQLDLKNRSVTRGAQKSPAATDERLVLPRQRVDLSILLPLGAEIGPYELQILREVDQPLVSAKGIAERLSGDTVLQIRADLSGLVAGKYLLGLRQPPWDWSFNPVMLE